MNYFQMTTEQLKQEHSTLQSKVRQSSPSQYWKELAQLGQVQTLLAYRSQQSEKNPVLLAARVTSSR